jgi:hypothetical protein
LDTILGRVATGVALGCAALVGLTSILLFVPSLRATFGFSAAAAPAYALGEQIDVPAEVYAASSATVLIFARSTCGACQRAQPEFTALISRLRSERSTDVRLMTTGAGRSEEASYARAIGLTDRELSVADARVRVRIVPSLVVVDRHGVIKFFSEGIPTRPQQEAVVRTVTELTTPR